MALGSLFHEVFKFYAVHIYSSTNETNHFLLANWEIIKKTNYVLGFLTNHKQVNYTLCNELLTFSHLSCPVSIKGKIGSDTPDLIIRSPLNCVDGLQKNLCISRKVYTQKKIKMPRLTTPQRLCARGMLQAGMN